MMHINDKTFATWEEVKKRQEDPDADMVYEIETMLGIEHAEFKILWAYQPSRCDPTATHGPGNDACYALTPFDVWQKGRDCSDGVVMYRPFAIITECSERGPLIFPTLVYAGNNGQFLYLSMHKGKVFRLCETIYATKEICHSSTADFRRFVDDQETLIAYMVSTLLPTHNSSGPIRLFYSAHKSDTCFCKYVNVCTEWLIKHSHRTNRTKRFHI